MEMLLPFTATLYYNLLLNDMFYIQRWYHVWICGMLNKWNEMKCIKVYHIKWIKQTGTEYFYWKYELFEVYVALFCMHTLRSWVHKFPAWHTKTAPNAKCSEGYIEPSIVRLLYQFQVATCSGMLEALVLVGRFVVSCWNVESRVPCCNQITHQRGACTSCYQTTLGWRLWWSFSFIFNSKDRKSVV